jgi:hypothetical protein
MSRTSSRGRFPYGALSAYRAVLEGRSRKKLVIRFEQGGVPK